MEDIAIVGLGGKDLDTVLGLIMFAFVGAAALAVLYLLGRHHHKQRKARKHARNHGHNHGHGSSHNHKR